MGLHEGACYLERRPRPERTGSPGRHTIALRHQMPSLLRLILPAASAIVAALLLGVAGVANAQATGGAASEPGSVIASLERRVASSQIGLSANRAELSTLMTQLGAARARLGKLEALGAHATSVLAAQLVKSYETGQPLQVDIVGQVDATRLAIVAAATRLGALQARREALATAIVEQRERLERVRVSVLAQRLSVLNSRQHAAAQIEEVTSRVGELEQHLSALEQAQGASGGRASTGTSSPLTFPLPKGTTSPPATWSVGQGIDIPAVAESPEYALCSGTIVFHGIGGQGPWAPVLHCDTPLHGHSYVFYGAAGPASELPIGTRVSAGQLIGSVGPGLVGISTGPHLDLGFADPGARPIGPQSAPGMLALLAETYGR